MGALRRNNVRVTGVAGGPPTVFAHGFGCDLHLPPLLVGPAGTRPVGRPGTLLGTVTVTDVEETLPPGASVVFFTDGVTEGRGPEGLFGDRRLAALLDRHRGAGADEVARAVVDEVVAFQEGVPRDDIALVVAGVPPAR